jgi:hypothetical protein
MKKINKKPRGAGHWKIFNFLTTKKNQEKFCSIYIKTANLDGLNLSSEKSIARVTVVPFSEFAKLGAKNIFNVST